MCKYKYYHNDKYITYTDTNRNMCANTNRRKAVGTICFSVVSDMSFCYTTIQPCIYPAIHNNMSLCYTHRPTIPASFALLPLSARYIYIYGFYGGCLAFGISLESIFWGSFTKSSSPFHFSVYQCVLLGDSLCVRPASPPGTHKRQHRSPKSAFCHRRTFRQMGTPILPFSHRRSFWRMGKPILLVWLWKGLQQQDDVQI